MRRATAPIVLLAALAAAGCAKGGDKSSDRRTDDPSDPQVTATKKPGGSGNAPPQQVEPDRPRPPAASPLQWHADEKTALALAKKERKPLLIDFGAEWCLPCKEFERRTFTDPAVIEKLSEMVLLRFDVTEQTDADEAVQKRYEAMALPTLIALSPDGAERARITEFLEPEPFLRALARLE